MHVLKEKMKDSQQQNFEEELKEWKNEILNDIDVITQGLLIQGDDGKASVIKFYRALSDKILNWKQFTRESNAARLKE
ncbi:hypothetical protein N9K89_05760 [Schleiferiaceae bacterium]|nr:hypothetical protein [Schleiferiaceae bacterium]